jgi:hypothetical protein
VNGTRVTATISSRSFYSKMLKTHHSQHISYDPEAGLLARRATSNGPLGSSNSRSRLRENDPPFVEPVQQGRRKCALGPRTHNCPMPAEGGFRSKKMLVRSSVLRRGRGRGKTQGLHTFPDNITSTISFVESLCTFSSSSPGLSRWNVL